MFGGSMVALVTPMRRDGELDLPGFAALLEMHLAQGTDGIVVGGTTGESPTVSAEELTRLVAEARRIVRDRIPVVAGSGTNSTRAAIALTRRMCEAGADACLVVTPYYNKPTQEGMYAHFSAIADAADRPVILYNVPSRTACDLLPETVARLAAHPRIAGLKEAAADGPARVARLRAACGPDFALLSGDDGTAADFVLAGGDGVISVTANIAPRAMHEMIGAARRGDGAAARRADAPLRALHEALFVESNPIPVKWTLAEMGLIAPGIRLPLTPLSERHHATVRRALDTATRQ
jgi:4-hydroxy-tetrahydrodipicolinate synthase